MKNSIFMFLMLTILISCKSESKKINKKDSSNKEQINYDVKLEDKVLKDIRIAPIDKWEFKGVSITETSELFENKDKVYSIKINDSAEKYATIAINNVKTEYAGGNYRISIVVKKGSLGSQLGLRIQEVYPTRIDVVYDLTNEAPKEIFIKDNDFVNNEKAEILALGNGWYKCILITELNTSYFRLLFGPTNTKKQVRIWESVNEEKPDLLIVPSSLKIEELEN